MMKIFLLPDWWMGTIILLNPDAQYLLVKISSLTMPDFSSYLKIAIPLLAIQQLIDQPLAVIHFSQDSMTLFSMFPFGTQDLQQPTSGLSSGENI